MKVLKHPNRIVLELTPLCNLACPMCPRHYVKDTDGFMPRALWFKLIDEIAEAAPDAIVLPFWRGESLLHPDFVELIDYALRKNLRIHISTNGILVKDEYAEVLSRCEFVTFSIHTPIGLKRAKAFKHLVDGMQGSKPTVQISFVTGEKTTEKLLEGIVDSPDLEGFDNIRLYEEHTKDGVFGSTGKHVEVQRHFCPKLVHTFVIAYDGSVSRCNHIWVPEQGPNLNQVSILQAWKSEAMNEIRTTYPDKQCGPCDQWTGHTLGASWTLVNGEIKKKIIGPRGAEVR